MINSCQKGKRVERELRDVLREAGYSSAERGQQRAGSPDSPDVRCKELPALHFECKGVQNLSIWPTMAKAVEDAGPDQMPVVAHKKNGTKFLVTMRIEDWLTLIRQVFPPQPTEGAA